MRKLLDNKIFQIVYGILKSIIVVLLIAYLVFVVVQRITNNSSIFGYRVFTVATGSMEPVYMVNDVILVKELDVNTLKVGDDVAYLGATDSNRGIIITHRIIRIEKNDNNEVRYYLKGVNNEYEDPSIAGSQIYGKVLGKVFGINFLNHVVKNIYGFFFLVFCPLVLVIFLEIADTIMDMRVEKNEIRLISDEVEKDNIDNTNTSDNTSNTNTSNSNCDNLELLDTLDGDDSEEII